MPIILASREEIDRYVCSGQLISEVVLLAQPNETNVREIDLHSWKAWLRLGDDTVSLPQDE
jgi:hypothetical protein